MKAKTLIDRLATGINRLSLADIPEVTKTAAATRLLDTLAAGVAGVGSEEAVRSRRAFAHDSTHGSATVWGTPHAASPSVAALLNGVAAHAYELDDSGGCDHSGAVVVPALLAASCVTDPHVNRQTMLKATVVGYEVGRRVQTALGGYDSVNNRGWHSTGVCGPFGAAAAAAVILELDVDQTANALGLAGAAASGSWAYMRGGMSKRLHAGRAAQGGLDAALLAAAGYTGPRELFEAPWGGFLDLYSGSSPVQAEALVKEFGNPWLIDMASTKPYATCRSTHSAIDALLSYRKNLPQTTEIVAIEVRTSNLIKDMCGHNATDTLAAAQLSLPFALAVACAYGSVELDDVLHAREDPNVRELVNTVTVVAEPARVGGSAAPQLLIHTSEDTAVIDGSDVPLGAWNNPVDNEAQRGKCLRLLSRELSSASSAAVMHGLLSSPTFGPAELNRLLRVGWGPATGRGSTGREAAPASANFEVQNPSRPSILPRPASGGPN